MNHSKFLRQWKRYMKHVLTHFSELGDCTTPRVNLNGIHGLWVIMMCQGRYTSPSKSTFWQGMLMLGEAMHVWGQECIQKISVPPSKFCYEPKLIWKKESWEKPRSWLRSPWYTEMDLAGQGLGAPCSSTQGCIVKVILDWAGEVGYKDSIWHKHQIKE